MLSKQLVPLAFWQGLDTKTDKKQQLFGKLRLAENVVFETLGSARKRNGYDELVLQTMSNQTISAEYLAGFKKELLVFSDTELYGYSASLSKLQERGAVYSVFPTTWPVVNNNYDLTQVDMVVVSGLKVFVYTRLNTVDPTQNAVYYCVQDEATQAMIVSDVLVGVGTRPRVVNLEGTVFIFYASGNDILWKSLNVFNPLIFTDYGTFATNLDNTNSIFDAIAVQSSKFVVVAYKSTNALAPLYINTLNINNVTGTPKQVNETPSAALNLYLDSSNNVIVTWSTGSVVKCAAYTALLGTKFAPVTVESGLSNVYKVLACEIQPGSYNVYYSTSATAAYNAVTRVNDVSSIGSVGTAAVFLRSVALASKAFLMNNNAYFAVSYDSTAQSTYFIVDTRGVVVAKLNAGVAGGTVNSRVLPSVYTSGSTALIPSLYKTKIESDNGDFLSLNGISNTQLDFADVNRFQNAALGNNMIIGGGAVQLYDGQVVVEQGFNVYPEKPTATVSVSATPNNNSGSRAILSGTYSYCVVYKWVDQFGQEHRSAPSEEVQLKAADFSAAGAGPYAVSLSIPTLRLTQKSNVTIEVYRTEASGSVLYLVNTATIPLINNKAADTVTFVDGLPDYTGSPPNQTLILATRRALYTTGGVLDNIAAPSAKIVATHTASQRIFLAGLEAPNDILYSKVVFPGQPVEFNDALRLSIDPVGGKITALASMDEKLIIFEEDATFFIGGSGPNNLGQQNDFTTPERVSTDVGCIDPKSVVLTPDGLMFKSRKGIYLLSRQLGVSYIGAPVEEYNSLNISSAEVVGELNQVRFTTSDGDCLVYNYVYKFWATFTNHKALSAQVIDNDYYYLRLNGNVYKENRTSFSDAGTTITMRLEIGWVSFNVLQGFSRVYRMLLLGDWFSRHNLNISVAYDFNEVYTQSVTVTPATAKLEATSYGEDSPYGEITNEPYGGYGNPYQVRVDFKQQKCQSMKMLIKDEQENAGQGFSLSQITFEVGGKAGLFKLGKGKKFGTA